MNRYPILKQFIRETGGADQYDMLKIKYITGHNPDLVIYQDNIEIERIDLKKYNNFKDIPSKLKFDITIAAIVGIAGLEPTIQFSKQSKKILLANKESIICGWHILSKIIKKNKTELIPIDSEHFSINQLTKDHKDDDVKKIYITASGGPFLRKTLKSFKKINAIEASKHPKWKMGKKISIDSATMMNKVFEIIEAKKIFDLSYKKLSILIHPKSYVHAIIKFKNGLTKIVAHDTSMKIPIFNSLYSSNNFINSQRLNIKVLNNLEFKEINYKRFPVIKILNKLPQNSSLFETILVSINDKLVELFLANKIKFTDISKKMHNILDLKELKKYKMIKPRKINDIIFLNNKIRQKIEIKNKI